jgi:hypothetical protein
LVALRAGVVVVEERAGVFFSGLGRAFGAVPTVEGMTTRRYDEAEVERGGGTVEGMTTRRDDEAEGARRKRTSAEEEEYDDDEVEEKEEGRRGRPPR